MSDKKSILVKAILDKTGITKGIKEIQALLDRIRLPLHTKIDTSEMQDTLKKPDYSSTSPPRATSSRKSGGLIRLFYTL